MKRILLALAVLLPGCALDLTTAMWNAQRSEPLALRQAVLARNGVIVADVDTTVGPLRLSKVPDATTDMMDVGKATGPLPEGRAIVVLPEGFGAESRVSSPSGAWIALGPSGHHDGQLQLEVMSSSGFRQSSLWYLRPVDFGRWQAWGAVVATPVTVALDLLVIGPSEFVWMFLTGGVQGPLFDFDTT